MNRWRRAYFINTVAFQRLSFVISDVAKQSLSVYLFKDISICLPSKKSLLQVKLTITALKQDSQESVTGWGSMWTPKITWHSNPKCQRKHQRGEGKRVFLKRNPNYLYSSSETTVSSCWHALLWSSYLLLWVFYPKSWGKAITTTKTLCQNQMIILKASLTGYQNVCPFWKILCSILLEYIWPHKKSLINAT